MKDDAVFVDTNILVYAFDKNEGERHLKAKQLLERCFRGETFLVTSVQVLSEFFVVATKKIEKPVSVALAKEIVQKIAEFKGFSVFVIKPTTVISAIDTCGKTGAHYWDALIAETMKENSIFKIFTENVADFKKISSIQTLNPFQ